MNAVRKGRPRVPDPLPRRAARILERAASEIDGRDDPEANMRRLRASLASCLNALADEQTSGLGLERAKALRLAARVVKGLEQS